MTASSSRLRAPAVQYPVSGRSVWIGAALALVSLASLSALIAWVGLGASRHPAWITGTAFALWLLTVGTAWRFASTLSSGVLAWDGQAWTFQGEPDGVRWGSLTVCIDLQHRMAVRLVGGDGLSRWIWLERCRDSARWGDLRRAVYSRPGQGVADAPEKASEGAGPV